MTNNYTLLETPGSRAIRLQDEKAPYLYLNGFTVQRIVLELIKKYMIANKPSECGVTLVQEYNIDPKLSKIFLDVAYNWRAQFADKYPAVFVQRGDIEVECPTIGQSTGYDAKESRDTKLAICKMPVIVSCIAAAPIAVVENLAEYVKQPLLSFRKEVKADFRLRDFSLKKVSSPNFVEKGKNIFVVDLLVDTAFDEGWTIQKEDLKLKSIGLEMFDDLCRVDTTYSGNPPVDPGPANNNWVSEMLIGTAGA
jgi:hypothetical protein